MESTLDIKYHPDFMSENDARVLFNELKTYNFQCYKLKVKGKYVTPSRKLCAFSDKDCAPYSFSGVTVSTDEWTPSLLALKKAVETSTKCDFNYGLLNYYASGKESIGVHKDDELSSDPDSPIACISLGAIRTMHFTRKNFKTEKLALENGSLLVMEPATNVLWSYGIPAEPNVTEPRISITFRKLRSKCNEHRPSQDCLPPAKRKCLEESFIDSTLDNFFTNIPESWLTSVSADTMHPSSKSETVSKMDIGDNVFLTCELFKDKLSVHIRQFCVNEKKELFPSKEGITMDLTTWYEFQNKLFSFNLYYSSSSFVSNNCVLVLNVDSNVQMSNLNTHKLFKLNCQQFNNLKDNIHSFNNKVIEYMLTTRFAYFVERERRLLAILSPEEEDILISRYIQCIEAEISLLLNKVFICNGCIIDHPSQLQHPCLVMSNSQKYEIVGDEMLLLLDMYKIVHRFIESVDFISENFVKNIPTNIIKDVLFKTIE